LKRNRASTPWKHLAPLPTPKRLRRPRKKRKPRLLRLHDQGNISRQLKMWNGRNQTPEVMLYRTKVRHVHRTGNCCRPSTAGGGRDYKRLGKKSDHYASEMRLYKKRKGAQVGRSRGQPAAAFESSSTARKVDGARWSQRKVGSKDTPVRKHKSLMLTKAYRGERARKAARLPRLAFKKVEVELLITTAAGPIDRGHPPSIGQKSQR